MDDSQENNLNQGTGSPQVVPSDVVSLDSTTVVDPQAATTSSSPPASASPSVEDVLGSAAETSIVVPDPVVEPVPAEENIIFTPEDYKKMTGQPVEEDYSWSVSSPVALNQAGPSTNEAEPLPSAPIINVQTAPPVQPATLETVFAPVPTQIAHPEEAPSPSAAIPNPESFYVGYKPETPGSSLSPDLEKRISEVSQAQQKKNKKLILTIVISVVAFLVIVGGSIGGYFLYQVNLSKKVLTSAWANIAKTTEATTSISLSINGEKFDATLDIDKEADARFKYDNKDFPVELVFIKKDDRLYIYDKAATTQTATATSAAKSWVEVSNFTKAINDYFEKATASGNFDFANIQTDGISQYITKQDSEVINGIKSYKYVFAPPAEFVNSALGEASSLEPIKSFGISPSKLKVEFWISETGYKFTRVKASVELKSGEGNNQTSQDVAIELNTKYDYKDDIKTSIRTKISQKIDLSKQLEFFMSNGFGGTSQGVSLSGIDQENSMLALQLKDALDSYFESNGEYPDIVSIPELVKSLSQEGLIDDTEDYSALLYSHVANPEGYKILFKLSDQEYEGENIVGKAPDKYYSLSSE